MCIRWKNSQAFQCESRVRQAVSRVMCLCGYRLFVVDANLIRQETACVLNTAGWTLRVHTLPVSLSFYLCVWLSSVLLLFRVSSSHIYTCCASLLFLFQFCHCGSLLLIDLKSLYFQLTSSSTPLLLLYVFCFWRRSTIITDSSTNSSTDSSSFSVQVACLAVIKVAAVTL